MTDEADTGGTGKLPLEFFQQLPKTDLHVHLDGSLRLDTILDIAKKQKVELPAPWRTVKGAELATGAGVALQSSPVSSSRR